MSSSLRRYWQGKTVLLTGASSGLGWAVVEMLAPFGVHFGLLSRRREPMEQLAEKLAATGSQFWIRTCDVRNREQVVECVREFHSHAGRIDVAWVNSGIGGDSSFRKWDWAAFEAMVDTNLKGAVYTIHACLEIMHAQGSGTVVGIGSAAAMGGLPARGVYSLTKIALEYFMLSKAAELPHLQFTIIHPGFVDTPINAGNPSRFWLQTPQRAARLMVEAVARHKRLFVFPRRMAWLFSLVRVLPTSLFLWIARKTARLSKPPQNRPITEPA